MEIVVNRCYGGFGLSEEAVLRYGELKGIKIYTRKGIASFPEFYTVSPQEYDKMKEEDEKNKNYEKSNSVYFSSYNIGRTDPILIQVVKELGEKANGSHAELEIVTIPDGIDWVIDEYDGMERVEEAHRSW
jgi:hypothetical protein